MVEQTAVKRRLATLARQIRGCIACPLCASRTNAVPGEGSTNARIMIIGEAPGRDEDRTGHPFVGASGRYLNQLLEGTGFHREDFFITNIVKCRPPSNRMPKRDEVETCTRLYLFKQMALVDPSLIVLLGGVAARKLLGATNLSAIRGQFLERDGRRFFATYHPAVRFHRDDLAALLEADFQTLQRELAAHPLRRDGASSATASASEPSSARSDPEGDAHMPQGDKRKYTSKQKRQAEHIEEGYEKRGTPKKEAERRAWATVNATTGGGKKSGSGRGKKTNKEPAKKGGRKGGAASAARTAEQRSASAKKAARTRARRQTAKS